MVKVTKVTKHYFVTDNNERVFFQESLDVVPSIEEMQELVDKKEADIRRMLELGKDNNS